MSTRDLEIDASRCVERLIPGDYEGGGKVSDRSRREAEAVVCAARQGFVPKPIRRPQRGDGHSGDFVDGDGQDWDVKSEVSGSVLREKILSDAAAAERQAPDLPSDGPIRGEFELAKTLRELEYELKAREKVLFDLRGLTARDADSLMGAVSAAGHGADVAYIGKRATP
jgi:hypothetical protein